MTLIECCALEALTCIFGCVVLLKYYENDMKIYDNIRLTQIKDNPYHIISDEKLKLLHVHEQPMVIIKHTH